MIIGSLIAVAFDSNGNIITDSLGRQWHRADGSAFNISSYQALYNIIGTRYGDTTPGTDFKLPDFRSRFLRGWDPTASRDEDAPTRTLPGPGATSADAGSVQPEIFVEHFHSIPGQRCCFDDTPPAPSQFPQNNSGPAVRIPSTFTSPITTDVITASNTSNARGTFGPSTEFLPYNMVVDFLIRIA